MPDINAQADALVDAIHEQTAKITDLVSRPLEPAQAASESAAGVPRQSSIEQIERAAAAIAMEGDKLKALIAEAKAVPVPSESVSHTNAFTPMAPEEPGHDAEPAAPEPPPAVPVAAPAAPVEP